MVGLKISFFCKYTAISTPKRCDNANCTNTLELYQIDTRDTKTQQSISDKIIV